MEKYKRIEVVAAIFINDKSEVFCARRKDYGDLRLKWEFPGGKVEIGESLTDALVREIKEELDVNISVEKPFMTVKHEYENFGITLHAFTCFIVSGKMALNEHSESVWMNQKELEKLDWADADLPIVRQLSKLKQ